MKLVKVLPVLGLFLFGACAAIPEDAWKPSSLDEMMGGKQVASFDTSYYRMSNGGYLPFSIDIDLSKGELINSNKHPNYSYQVYHYEVRKYGSGYCIYSPKSPSYDKMIDGKMWWCYSVQRTTTKDGEELFRIIRSDGSIAHTEIRRR